MVSLSLKKPLDLTAPLIIAVFAALALIVPYFGKDQIWPIAAAAYVVTFWVVGWFRPEWAMLLIIASAPFQNDLSEGGLAKFSFTEINLALIMPLFVVRQLVLRRTFTLGPVGTVSLLYLAVCLFTNIMYWHNDARDITAGIAFMQMVLYLVMTVMLFCCFCEYPHRLFSSFYALVIVGTFLAVIGLVTQSNYILGLHKNGVGASLASCLVIAVEMWFVTRPGKARVTLLMMTALIFVGLMLTLSRGAWIAAGVGLLILLLNRREYRLIGQLALLLIPLGAIVWFSLSPESKAYVTGFEPERQNISLRYESVKFAQARFEMNPVYGIGGYLRKEYDATNIVWCLLAETGIAGLFAFTLIYAVLGWMVLRTKKLLRPSDPMFSLMSLGAALAVGRLAHGMVDHYWSRGAITTAWAAIGLATAAYFIATGRGSERGLHRP